MDRNSSKETHRAIDRHIEDRVDQAGAEESLSEALNGLEQILEHRQARRPEAEQPEVLPPEDANADPQYTIPLLHDVVVPGSDEAPDAITEHGDADPLEAGVEQAQAYHEDIREQVRNHLEIMLPEIIEELNALARRQGG
jgi:hypothetical protein